MIEINATDNESFAFKMRINDNLLLLLFATNLNRIHLFDRNPLI